MPGSSPTVDAAAGDDERRARLLRRLTWLMLGLAALGAGAAVLETRNQAWVTASFYGVVIAWLIVVAWVTRRGRLVLAAWLLTSMFWLLIALVTVMFGGLQGETAACFTVCVLLLGSLVSGRSALLVALVSAAWCGGIAIVEVRGGLPAPLAPYSAINSWAAVTITLILTAVLLANSLDRLRALHARAEASARERDEALRRSIEGQKMELVGKVSAGIAHDFNNLLTVMMSVAEVLRRQLGAAPATASLLDALDESISRATLLSRQLVALGHGRRAAGEVVDAGEVVAGLARMLPHLLGHRITVDTRAPAGAFVAAPRVALEHIVLNLAVNAKVARPAGGRLRLLVEAGAATVTLIVEDEGAGMDAATRARIFEPFFTTKPTGTGLGLATVQRLVGDLGGAIVVDSEPDRGARFAVELPRAEPAAVPRPPAPRRRGKPPPLVRRVLVVEDDAAVRRTITQWLVADGFEPIPVAGGIEALAIAEATTELACVVSDLSMPGMDGETLASRLAVLRPSLPVVLISGDRAPASAAMEGGRRSFVAKPLAHATVSEAVAAALDDVTA
jgi:signal transduction histidine kinase